MSWFLYLYLPLFRYSPAFLHFSSFFVLKNPNWVTRYPLSVLNRVFVYIWSEILTVKSFPKWRRKMHTKIHWICMKNLYTLYIYLDRGATVQLIKALLSASISLFWDKNSQFLMEPNVNLQNLEIFGWKVWVRIISKMMNWAMLYYFVKVIYI